MSKQVKRHRTTAIESSRIDPPPDDAESWIGAIPRPSSRRRLPMPVYPVIAQNESEPSREIAEIATVLYSAFDRCIWAMTEKKAGNHLLMLVHGGLHKRLDDLRTLFVQEMMSRGIAYKEAADPFDAMVSAFDQFSLIAAFWMFDEEGRKKSHPGERWLAAAGKVTSEYASAKATFDRMLDFLAKAQRAKAPMKPTWDGCKLEYNGVVLKEYKKHPAINQRMLLAAFQDAGWPPTIQNPWYDSKLESSAPLRTLNETLRAINKNKMITRSIRFEAIGNGHCRWEAVAVIVGKGYFQR